MVPMSVSLKLLQTNLIVNLIFKRQNLQTLTAASWRDSMWRGSKNGKMLNFQHNFFVFFLAICQELVKKIIYPKKSRGHRPSKRVKSKQS